VTGIPPADEQLEFLKLVVRRLEATGIPYMLTGSIALAIYSTPRMTRDVDILIDCDANSARHLATAFAEDSYVSEDAVEEAVRTRGSFNVIHQAWLTKADFFVLKEDEYQRTEFSRRRTVELGGFSASVVAPEDLARAGLEVPFALGGCAGSSGGSRTVKGMNDTSIEVEQLQRRLLMERSPAERLRMATGMFRTARALSTAGVLAQLGAVSPERLRRELLWRFYGIDPTLEPVVDAVEATRAGGS
jgi:hypothetical protein